MEMYNVVVGSGEVLTVKARETHGAVEAYLQARKIHGVIGHLRGSAALTSFGDARYSVTTADGRVVMATVRRKADVRYKRWSSVLA